MTAHLHETAVCGTCRAARARAARRRRAIRRWRYRAAPWAWLIGVCLLLAILNGLIGTLGR